MISKISLSIDMFYEKNHFEAFRPVLDMSFNVYDLHGILDASRCRMLHRQWIDHKSFWLDCHGISWCPNALSVGGKTVNLGVS